MRFFPVGRLSAKGELLARMLRNLSRIDGGREYLPGRIGIAPYMSAGWDGDWEGRTILALSLHAQALGIEPAYLEGIVDWVRSLCGEKGYRGEPFDPARINEQQLASHSWLMRGLIEYHRLTADSRIPEWLERIFSALFLPVREHLANYPGSARERPGFDLGQPAGTLAGSCREWLLSSDTGCLFIAIDGLTALYEHTGLADALAMAEDLIRLFVRQDWAGTPMQTHACLTGMRGVMRAYALTKDPGYLDAARSFFETYKRQGMSEYFANFDWFRTPSWSEPCGVIDSYMLALQLWKETRSSAYLDDAMHIWYNGVLRGQRPNGGFGCDSCAEDGLIRATDIYEAYWCCTMRGAEGLGTPLRWSVLEENGTLVFPLYTDADMDVGSALLRERTGLPDEGSVTIRVERGELHGEAALFIPGFASGVSVEADGRPAAFRLENGFARFRADLRAGGTAVLRFGLPVRMVPTAGEIHDGKGLFTIRRGPCVLAAGLDAPDAVGPGDIREENGAVTACGHALHRLGNEFFSADGEIKAARERILFRKKD